MVDALANLAKELACPNNKPLFMLVENLYVLAHISLEFIKSMTYEGEVATLEVDIVTNWRTLILKFLLKGKLPQ